LLPPVPQALAHLTAILRPAAMQLGILATALRRCTGAFGLFPILFTGHLSPPKMRTVMLARST
jgi:hypothetical protein